MEVERVFIGAGCNRVVYNVSWGASGLVSFGAQNAVPIFCPKTAQILTTLPGHKASVNCTLWLPNSKFAFKAKQLELHFLLSGDAEGVIILWMRSEDMSYKCHKPTKKVLPASRRSWCLSKKLFLHLHPLMAL